MSLSQDSLFRSEIESELRYHPVTGNQIVFPARVRPEQFMLVPTRVSYDLAASQPRDRESGHVAKRAGAFPGSSFPVLKALLDWGVKRGR
jgi:hypothetical protein